MPGVFDCAAPRQTPWQGFRTGQQQPPCGFPAAQHEEPPLLSFELSFSNDSSFDFVVQGQASVSTQPHSRMRDPRLQGQMTQRKFPSGHEQPGVGAANFCGANGLCQQAGGGRERPGSGSQRTQQEENLAFRARISGQQQNWQGRECRSFRGRPIMGWTPEVLSYYSTNRAKKPRLEPSAQQQGSAILGRAAADFAFKHKGSKRQQSTESALAAWEASKQTAEPEAFRRSATSVSRGFRVLGAVAQESVPRSACDKLASSGGPKDGLLGKGRVAAVGRIVQLWRSAEKERNPSGSNLGMPQLEHSRCGQASSGVAVLIAFSLAHITDLHGEGTKC